MNAVANGKNILPKLESDGKMNVNLSGNHFQQNISTNYDVINIYCVHKLDPIASTRDTSDTIQNALFGAMQILKMLLIMIKIIIKHMVYVLMKEVNLVIQ